MQEQSIRELQTKIRDFRMPEITPGSHVLYFTSGKRDRSSQSVGTIVRVSARNVMLVDAEGLRREAVPHISDPRLQLNDDQRENGAWDYSSDYLLLRELEKRVNELELKTGVVQKELESTPEQPHEEYTRLREQAIKLGIEFKGNPKKEWLVKEIDKRTIDRGA